MIPPTILSRCNKIAIRATAAATNTAVGIIERKIRSNFWVKSKSPRHPRTPGPKEPSFRQVEVILRDLEGQDKKRSRCLLMHVAHVKSSCWICQTGKDWPIVMKANIMNSQNYALHTRTKTPHFASSYRSEFVCK